MKKLHLALTAVLAFALASCAPQGCVAGGPVSPAQVDGLGRLLHQGYAQPGYAPPVVYTQHSYAPPAVVVVSAPAPARRTVVLVKQTPAPVIRTGPVYRAPAPAYRSQVSTYRSSAGSTSGGSFGGRRR